MPRLYSPFTGSSLKQPPTRWPLGCADEHARWPPRCAAPAEAERCVLWRRELWEFMQPCLAGSVCVNHLGREVDLKGVVPIHGLLQCFNLRRGNVPEHDMVVRIGHARMPIIVVDVDVVHFCRRAV